MNIIEGAYLRDILDQPRALAASLDGLAGDPRLRPLADALAHGAFTRIVLTGMGSSLHALHPLNMELAAAGFTPLLVETAELVHSLPLLLGAGSLVVAVSQSGRSAEIVRLLADRPAGTPVIGVTNTPDSPLAAGADALLLTRAGDEFSVSCKTYVAALAALRMLGATLCRGDAAIARGELDRATEAVREYLANWRDHVYRLAALSEGMRHLFLVGRGASQAAALTGGLILKESTHLAAEGMSSAAFRHGPLDMVAPGTTVLVFGGEEKTRDMTLRLCHDIRKHGGTVMAVGLGADLPALALPQVAPALLPILEILPVEMLTLALAALQDFESGRFSNATKVTTVE